MGLAFGVLGPLEVRRDGIPIPLPSGRRRAVLAALLVRANQPVPRDVLIEAGWGTALPADPPSALRTVVSRLRAALGPGRLRLEPAGYVLAAGPEELDAARFDALCARATGAPPSAAAALLDEALALWRGPAYAEFADQDVARGEAVRLDELRVSALELRAELSLGVGDVGAAVIALEGLVGEQPFRERARGLLMTALYRAGRPAEALERYRDYRTLLADELGLDPSPMLRDLEIRILGHDVPQSAPPRPRSHRPTPPVWLPTDTAFIGREEDAARFLDAAVAHRLVTVTGVGGVGKSRLVAETLSALGQRLDVPVTVAELADVTAGQVDTTVAAALGLGNAGASVRETVLEYLSISTALLVLDNCEHVLSEARALAASVLHRCPGVRLVATSRRRLGLVDEQAIPLEPLPTLVSPNGPEGAELPAAVRLLVDRITRVRPTFALTPNTLPAVADVARRLDGLPLALELAATRVAALGVEPLRARLDRSLDLLGENEPSRRNPLGAVVDWSYRLLDPDERRLLATLSVLDGDFDLEAAEQVCAPGTSGPVAVGLARLVEASLVSTHEVAGETRYRMLMIVRAFAADRLSEAGEEDDARAVHARWVQALVEDVARGAAGSGSTAALAQLRRNRGNVTASVRWALRVGRVQLAGQITGALGLCPHWHPDDELLGLMAEVARHPAVRRTPAASLALGAGALAATERGELADAELLATEALQRATEVPERCLALLTLAIANVYAGQHERSAGWWRELLAVEDLPGGFRVDSHACLALLAAYQGNCAEAHEEAARARSAAEAVGAEGNLAFATYVAGEVALLEDPEAAVMVLREAADQADRAGLVHVVSVARIALLSALTRLGRSQEAIALVPPLLQDEHRMGRWPQLWTTVRVLAELLVTCDQHATAALLLAAADAAPSAPRIAGEDVERYHLLGERIGQRIGFDVVGRITVLARSLPRAQVIQRALAAADNLHWTA